MENGRLLKAPNERLCTVCGDIALGVNFSARCCESCKAFFRRSAIYEERYFCSKGGHCEIDKSTRRSCIACRLQKCFKNGMKKELIYYNRKVNQKHLALYDQYSDKVLQLKLKYTVDPHYAGKPLERSELNLLYHVRNATRMFIIKKEPDPGSQPVGSVSELFNYVHECAPDLTRFCKYFTGYKALCVDDQLLLLKYFNTSFHAIMIASVYSFEQDAFVVIGNALKNSNSSSSPQQTVARHVNCSIYSQYEKDNISQLFRSLYNSLRIEMEGDLFIRDLLVALQLFRMDPALVEPEVVKYQNTRYTILLRRYLENKYRNEREAERKLRALLHIVDGIDNFGYYISLILQHVDQSQIADLTKEIYVVG